MKHVKNIFIDVLKCIAIGAMISVGLTIITGAITLIADWGNKALILEWAKRMLYYAGGFGMFLSAGAFAQRDGVRPFIYNEEWKRHFRKLNIGFVIMIISISIVAIGMIIQNYAEFGII